MVTIIIIESKGTKPTNEVPPDSYADPPVERSDRPKAFVLWRRSANQPERFNRYIRLGRGRCILGNNQSDAAFRSCQPYFFPRLCAIGRRSTGTTIDRRRFKESVRSSFLSSLQSSSFLVARFDSVDGTRRWRNMADPDAPDVRTMVTQTALTRIARKSQLSPREIGRRIDYDEVEVTWRYSFEDAERRCWGFVRINGSFRKSLKIHWALELADLSVPYLLLLLDNN